MTDTTDQFKRLEPWMKFVTACEGSELGEQFSALLHAVDVSMGIDDEMAQTIMREVESRLIEFRQQSWWGEMMDRADEGWEDWIRPYRPEDQIEKARRNPKPSDQYFDLPELVAHEG